MYSSQPLKESGFVMCTDNGSCNWFKPKTTGKVEGFVYWVAWQIILLYPDSGYTIHWTSVLSPGVKNQLFSYLLKKIPTSSLEIRYLAQGISSPILLINSFHRECDCRFASLFVGMYTCFCVAASNIFSSGKNYNILATASLPRERMPPCSRGLC